MARPDLTKGFSELGKEDELRPYLERLTALAGQFPRAAKEIASYEELNEAEGSALLEFADEWSRSLAAISLKYEMSGRISGQSGHLTVDRAGSGLPIWQEMVSMAQDKESAEEVVSSMRTPKELRGSMLKTMLRDQVSPAPQQYAMSQRLYLDKLIEGEVTLPRSLMGFKFIGQAENGRNCYQVSWSVIDVQSNCPVVYLMQIEDSSGHALTPEDQRLTRLRSSAFGQSHLEQCILDMAISLDQLVSTLHPKRLRRVTFGPFLSPTFSAGTGNMLRLLRSAAPTSDDDWALRVQLETVDSVSEFRSGGLLSSNSMQEFSTNVRRRDGYLMTALPFQALCEGRDPDFFGIRKYVLTSPEQITAYS
ncbi:hypothetical protein KUV57_11955 [Epibacterium sp. DP7N7-1]|nr:hypothetical protein [Epibacterium sp. DP7N7-1]